MKLTVADSLAILNLESPFNLIQLKDAYRVQIRSWHPDLNPDRLKEATDRTQAINFAYDLLEVTARAKTPDRHWSEYMRQQLPEWEKKFRSEWRSAYQASLHDLPGLHRGLHVSTAIINFRRAAIEPRREWFLNCLFEDSPQMRTFYREHLLAIAPNPTLREDFARRYLTYEFGEGAWIFYLPASKALLTARSP